MPTSALLVPDLFNRSRWNFKYSYLKVCARDSVNGNTVVLTVTVIVTEPRKCRMATPTKWLHSHELAITFKIFKIKQKVRNRRDFREFVDEKQFFALFIPLSSDQPSIIHKIHHNCFWKIWFNCLKGDQILKFRKLVGIDWSLLNSPSYTYTHWFSLIDSKI